MSGAIPNRLRIEKAATPRVEPPYLTHFADWLPTFRAAWKVAQQYPPDHPQVGETLRLCAAALARAVAVKSPITCVAVERALSIDGLPLEERRPGVMEFAEGMIRFGIRALTFFQGADEKELRELIALFCDEPHEVFDRGGGARELTRKRLFKIRATPIKQAAVSSAKDEAPAASYGSVGHEAPEDRVRKLDAVTASHVRLTSKLSAEVREIPELETTGRAEAGLISLLTGETDELSDPQYFQLLAALDDPERMQNLITGLVTEQFARGTLSASDHATMAQTISRIARLLRQRSPQIWNDCKAKLASSLAQLGNATAAGVFSATTGLDAELAANLDELAAGVSDDDACRLLVETCSRRHLNQEELAVLFVRLSQHGERAAPLATMVKETLSQVYGAGVIYGETLEPIFVEIMTSHFGGDSELEHAMLALRSHRPDASLAEKIQSEIHDLLDESSTLSARTQIVATLIELLEQETDAKAYQRLLESVGEIFDLLTREAEYALLRDLVATVRRHAQTKPVGVLDLAQQFMKDVGEQRGAQSMLVRILFADGRRETPEAHGLLGLLDELSGDVAPLIITALRDPRKVVDALTPGDVAVATPRQRLRLRQRCIQLLTELRDDRGWSALIEVAGQSSLSRESVLLRCEAIHALRAAGTAPAVECLTAILKRKTWLRRGLNDILRAEAAQALSQYFDSEHRALAAAARGALRARVRDANPDIRALAARAQATS